MIVYDPNTDIMATTDMVLTPRLTTDCLLKMMNSCVWAEKVYLELGLYNQARRYSKIWKRLFMVASDRMLKRNA